MVWRLLWKHNNLQSVAFVYCTLYGVSFWEYGLNASLSLNIGEVQYSIFLSDFNAYFQLSALIFLCVFNEISIIISILNTGTEVWFSKLNI